jgi:hypothetical protein
LAFGLRLVLCYLLGVVEVTPPHFGLVAMAAVDFLLGRSPFVFVSFIRCTPCLDMGQRPRFRVFYQQSANPYVAVCF